MDDSQWDKLEPSDLKGSRKRWAPNDSKPVDPVENDGSDFELITDQVAQEAVWEGLQSELDAAVDEPQELSRFSMEPSPDPCIGTSTTESAGPPSCGTQLATSCS